MERYTETDCSKCGVPVNVDLDPQGDLVRYDDAKRALDAALERLKGQIDYSIQLQQLIESLKRDDTPSPELYHHKIIVEFKRQLATLQARVTALERDNAAMKQLFHANPSALWGQLATLQAQVKQLDRTLADVYQQRDGLQAQLRQVEGERDGLEQNCLDNHVATEQADAKVLKLEGEKGLWASERIALLTQLENAEADIDTLRQLVEALPVLDMRFDSVAVGPLGWTVGGVTFGRVTEANAYSALLQYRATLAAKDAGKGVGNGV